MAAPPPPVHRAARLETAFERTLAGLLARHLGWRPQLIAYAGYGAAPGAGAGDGGWVRLLARVLMLPPRPQAGDEEGGRGWRRFLTIAGNDADVRARVAGRTYVVRSGAGGYVDAVVPVGLDAGRHRVELAVEGSAPVAATVHVVGPEQGVGVVSDVDDTVMVTALPRPLLAAWNTFVRPEAARRPVPGMAGLLHVLRAGDPDALVVYLSTGAWNVAPSVARFLRGHGYPEGPLLLTDWGPTAEGWFRSGQAHKRRTLRRLVRELPHLRWALVGDDGQHDPALYAELVGEAPQAVRLVAIRQLTPTEQALTHGLPTPLPDGTRRAAGPPWLLAPDGAGLSAALSAAAPAARPQRSRR